MPDAARIAQAQALEIPVTVQGAKAADETGRRELFTESAKTTLTFDNGAVLNLRTRVTPGQSVFLRNDQSGHEILCKVLEAPPEGEPGYTDLEFMEIAPGFWESDPEEPQAGGEKPEAIAQKSEAQTAAEKPVPAAAGPQPAAPAKPTAAPGPAAEKPAAPAHQETEAAADNSLAMMGSTASEANLPPAKAPEEEEKRSGPPREELVPAHEMIPQTPPAPSATEPTGEQIDAALRAIARAPLGSASDGTVEAPAPRRDAAEPSDAKDEANLAALMAREARLAKYAALKEKAAAQIGRRPAAHEASKDAVGAEKAEGTEATGEAVEEVAGPPKVPLAERLTTGKNLVRSEIAVCVVIVVALALIWHAVSGLFIHPSERPVAAARATKAGAPNARRQVVVPGPAAPIAKVPAARPTVVASAPVAKVVRSSPAPSRSAPETIEETGPHVVAPEAAVEEPKRAEPVAPKVPEIVPAKIVAQSQPPMPPWAKSLDVATVVKLDVVIDEKGNLGKTKIVSGPRLLERAAEQAVQLWIFEPAQWNGKPAATHMVVTVEFQR